ncbi:PLP-dependent aminotransferase family protein [Amycolatopsis acidiphila]|uniref:MocR-like transcription factor YczR n=1 Tax=Amycolatopsis acidiphila TaxID=715473 RepID=UPI001643EA70|nr:PLP-dependent aminotransferase family protein [Amycolatopsis acidiphila]UIJ60454.1 PLP-dependent aminotransferase family protein [Amycolatopsis acidiphila]GHG82806.1 GntR family transcriptional regulator [Amycolatopsis acidiphila]
MNTYGGRISGQRLATLLGSWRRGSRQGAVALASAIELQVLDGHLPVGTQLPAERELAEALGASRTLIGAALDRLRENGLVASRRGAGSWVTSPRSEGSAPIYPTETEDIDLVCASAPAVPGMINAVDAARRLLVDELGGTGYGERGLLVLRERLAQRYTERGLPTSPAQIMITNGAHHAFVLALRMLANPGDRVLVEQPTYPNTLEAIRAAHALPVPVALGEDGWDFEGIEAALRQAAPRLAYLILDFHNPTGLRMDDAGRERLAALLTKARTSVVVDETLVELDFTNAVAPRPFAAGDWSILVGTSSKSHWGGLRIGWMRASEDVLARLSSARFGLDLGSPVFEQLVLSELLADPEPLRRRREGIRQQRDALADAVRAYCPEWTFRFPGGGFWLWCKLPEPMSTRLAVAAASRGVLLAPGSRFGAHGGLERWIRLPFSQPPDRLDEAMRRISLAAESVRGGTQAVPVT